MPSPITLPAAAQENMSERAIEQVADRAPHVAPPPGVNTIYSTAANETLFGTDGPDVFVFDGSTPQGIDTIVGFDVTEDRIEFILSDFYAIGFDPGVDGQTSTFLYPNVQVTVDVDPQTLDLSDTVTFKYPTYDVLF